jgi:hypothetical protein
MRRTYRGLTAHVRVPHVLEDVDHHVPQRAALHRAQVDVRDRVVVLRIEAERPAGAVDPHVGDDLDQALLVLHVPLGLAQGPEEGLGRVVARAQEVVGLLTRVLAELHEGAVLGDVVARGVVGVGVDADRGVALRAQHVLRDQVRRPDDLDRALQPEVGVLLDERHRVAAREVGEHELGLRVLDGREVGRVVGVVERGKRLADHGAARLGERLLEVGGRLLAEGEVEHADVGAVAELGLGPGPERRGRLPGAVREAEVVARAALLGEQVVGGDGVQPELLGVHDGVADGRRDPAVDGADDHVHLVAVDELAHLAHPHARVRGVVLLDDGVGAARDGGPRLLGPEHEAGEGVLAQHREGLRERE